MQNINADNTVLENKDSFELTDQEWNAAKEFISTPKRGRPPKSNRDILNGILWYVAHPKATWRDVPEKYGSRASLHEKYVKWRDSGVLDAILGALNFTVDEQAKDSRSYDVLNGFSLAFMHPGIPGGAVKYRSLESGGVILDAKEGVLPDRAIFAATRHRNAEEMRFMGEGVFRSLAACTMNEENYLAWSISLTCGGEPLQPKRAEIIFPVPDGWDIDEIYLVYTAGQTHLASPGFEYNKGTGQIFVTVEEETPPVNADYFLMEKLPGIALELLDDGIYQARAVLMMAEHEAPSMGNIGVNHIGYLEKKNNILVFFMELADESLSRGMFTIQNIYAYRDGRVQPPVPATVLESEERYESLMGGERGKRYRLTYAKKVMMELRYPDDTHSYFVRLDVPFMDLGMGGVPGDKKGSRDARLRVIHLEKAKRNPFQAEYSYENGVNALWM